MYKYTVHYNKREYSGRLKNTETLSFDIFDNDITRAWREVIMRKLAQEDTENRDYSIHTSFPALNNKYQIFERICNNVSVARQLNPDLEWPDNLGDINQDRLNYLHERFHEAKDFTLRTDDIDSVENIVDIRRAFTEINHDIHALENIIEFEKRSTEDPQGAENRMNYHVLNFGLFDKDLRLPVTPELREAYWRDREDPIVKPVQLWLGYATVGKNMMHCVVNDDYTVVKDNMLRPQMDIGGETLCIVHNGVGWQRTHGDSEQRHNEYIADLQQFMSRNKLHRYADMQDIHHTHCRQPVLGMVADEHDTWTERDYFSLFTEYKLSHVEIT
jgi:hypothetical protein